MPRREARNDGKLSAVKIKKLRDAGRYGDGRGLYLQVSQWGTKSWIFRYMIDGQARQMGLGSIEDVPLAKAREKAKEQRALLADDIDPIESRRERRAQRRLALARQLSFRECAERYIAAHATSWKNEKHKWQWRQTLEAHAYPVFGDIPVADIDTALVTKALEPIWNEKRETASRLRGRIERILDWARARGFRKEENAARWNGHLKHLLPNGTQPVRHHPALPYSELPSFMGELRQQSGTSARALEFMILTAARTVEVIGAKWSEIDLAEKSWTVPAERMKAAREHRVPLSDRAIEILGSLPSEDGSAFVFIGGRAGKPLSNMAMLKLMRGLRPGYVPHGFRSTFRTWASERTNYPREVCEAALAHTIESKVEAAYRRGDLFLKRRRLMQEWAKFCGQLPVIGKVVRLQSAVR